LKYGRRDALLLTDDDENVNKIAALYEGDGPARMARSGCIAGLCGLARVRGSSPRSLDDALGLGNEPPWIPTEARLLLALIGKRRGAKPGFCHAQENVPFAIGARRFCPPQALIGKFAIFLRHHDDATVPSSRFRPLNLESEREFQEVRMEASPAVKRWARTRNGRDNWGAIAHSD
jgi:hypothetical protein